MAEDTILQLDGIVKLFGKVRAVDGSSLEVKRGEIFTLLGPSGCGKTTTLRMVAGLERPDGGRILYKGQPVADTQRRVFVPPHKRNMGMVFQSYAIWPHMTVFENVAYPLRLRGVKGPELRDRVDRVLALVGLTGMAERPAPMLSGGQQQRVAICRALVYEPDLLLLDEPFSNLDAKLRNQMRVEVKLLQRRLGISVLFVTHDQVEALTLSDRIAVMSEGHVEQQGTPAEMYDKPATAFVRDFLGQTVSMKGTLVQPAGGKVGVSLTSGTGTVATVYCLEHSLQEVKPGEPAYLSIRPEDINVIPKANGVDSSQPNAIPGVIETLLFVGDRFEARIGIPSGESILLQLQGALSGPRGSHQRPSRTPHRARHGPDDAAPRCGRLPRHLSAHSNGPPEFPGFEAG
ncbi:MAG: Spermidine/putrescine transporter ATP-binding protein [Dehalococcoidia bacterium]|nr:Spermidine/putrescine transporter ATP-binding protein [Dehalococcoidia bacterium]